MIAQQRLRRLLLHSIHLACLIKPARALEWMHRHHLRRLDNCHHSCRIVRDAPCHDCDFTELNHLTCHTNVALHSTDEGAVRYPSSQQWTYPIELPLDFVQEHADKIHQGSFYMCIHDLMFDPQRQVLLYTESVETVQRDPLDTSLSIPDRSISRRRLERHSGLSVTGTKRLLAVRVTSSTEEPEESLASIQGALFGTGPNPDAIASDATVAAQYHAVSHGQLTFVPPDGTTGVLDVSVNAVFAGGDVSGLTSTILSATEAVLGRPLLDVADTFVFCLPTGSSFEGDGGWTAFTHLLEPYSYYQLSRCTRLSVVMHEIGHSFGFQHSGTADDLYGDKTDYMGFAANLMGTPRKGFNAHKHWISGWFDSRAFEIDPVAEGSVNTRLVAFVHSLDDSSLSDTDAFVLRVGPDLYVQYNRATGYNVDTTEPNTVTVTEATAVHANSVRVAALAAGQRYTVPKYQDGHALVIEVCSLESANAIDSATVSIYWDNGQNQSTCQAPPKRVHWWLYLVGAGAGVAALVCFVLATRVVIHPAPTPIHPTVSTETPKPMDDELSTIRTDDEDGDDEGVIAQVSDRL